MRDHVQINGNREDGDENRPRVMDASQRYISASMKGPVPSATPRAAAPRLPLQREVQSEGEKQSNAISAHVKRPHS